MVTRGLRNVSMSETKTTPPLGFFSLSVVMRSKVVSNRRVSGSPTVCVATQGSVVRTRRAYGVGKQAQGEPQQSSGDDCWKQADGLDAFELHLRGQVVKMRICRRSPGRNQQTVRAKSWLAGPLLATSALDGPQNPDAGGALRAAVACPTRPARPLACPARPRQALVDLAPPFPCSLCNGIGLSLA